MLVGALLPVAGALQATGAADLIAGALVSGVAQGTPTVALVLSLVITMPCRM